MKRLSIPAINIKVAMVIVILLTNIITYFLSISTLEWVYIFFATLLISIVIIILNRNVFLRYFDQNISSSTIKVFLGVAFTILIWSFIGFGIIHILEIPTYDNISQKGFTYMLITDPGTILDSFKGTNTPESKLPFLCIISIIGFILVCGIMISVFSNLFQRRVDDYKNGVIRYKHLKNHIVIIGFDEILPSLVRQKCEESDSNIIILSKKNSKEVREHVNSMLSKREEKRVIVYCGRRDSKDELRCLNLKKAKEVYILGNRQNEGHDALNIDCLVKMKDLIGEWEGGKEKIPVKVMFDNYATFSAFQASDLSENWRKSFKFIPFNFYEYWAQKVIVNHKYNWEYENEYFKYPKIEGETPLRGTDDVVNVIIFGITSMGVAIATQAAHYLHFSRKKDGSLRKSRITFICGNAREEINMFHSFYSGFFEIQSSIFRDFVEGDGQEEVIPPTYFKGKQSDFLDIEFEFVNGESYHPKVRDYLRKLANDSNLRISIFISTGNDRRDINIGMSLPEELYYNENQKTTPIFVHQKKSGELLRLLEDISNEKYKEIYPFGMIDTNLDITPKNLVRAQLLNLSYSKDWHENDEKAKILKLAKDKWDELNPALQWSSIYCANSNELKLREFGLTNIRDKEELSDHINDYKDELCEIEQNRWNVEKLLMGFRKPHENEQETINRNWEEKFISSKKKYIHDLIRPYEQIERWKGWKGVKEHASVTNEEMILSIPEIEEIVSKQEKEANWWQKILNKFKGVIQIKHIIRNKYIPAPIDTSDIQLTDELNLLLEEMAKNVHETWAKERISQGWTFGEKRDDTKKQHPGLVAYEDLPEEEKIYDRNTSVETIKLIMKLGFKIEKR